MDSESGARSKDVRLGLLLGHCHDPVQEKITAAVAGFKSCTTLLQSCGL